jgi:hypothetical protein
MCHVESYIYVRKECGRYIHIYDAIEHKWLPPPAKVMSHLDNNRIYSTSTSVSIVLFIFLVPRLYIYLFSL